MANTKVKTPRLKILLSGLFLISLANCNAQMAGLSSSSTVTKAGDHIHCFPGSQQDNSVCFPLIEVENLNDPNGDYAYRNPETDPSFPESFDVEAYRAPIRYLDLNSVSATINLAPNFQLGELMSASKGIYGLYSVPALTKIQEMRDAAGSPLIVNSAYRSPGYNAKLDGSAKWSRHTFGDALDFYSRTLSLKQLRDLCLKHGASFFQLYRSHIHCDWRYIERDNGFFPAAVREPSVTTAAKALSADTSIQVREISGAWQLTVSHPPGEDGGELEYLWTITQPNGHKVTADTKSLVFRPRLKGIYHLEVTVGGSIHQEIMRNWP